MESPPVRARSARLLAALVILAACSAPPEPSVRERSTRETRRAEVAPAGPPSALPPARLPAPARMVAIGDVHGDLSALRSALRLAGAIDESDRWSGGALWIVQTGDVLDRGDDEDQILAMITRLEQEAAAAGGRFLALLGNHELMNVQGDFRYVTPDGFADFDGFADRAPRAARARIPREMLGRAAAFAPGGRYARELAARNTVVVVGDTVLVHGGLSARDAGRDLEAINLDVRRFLLGEAPLPASLRGDDSPVWHRGFATDDDPETCEQLAEVLARVGAHRMVVGHTVQRDGITSACDGRVWRIDVGLAHHYGGPTEVLELAGGSARVLRATTP